MSKRLAIAEELMMPPLTNSLGTHGNNLEHNGENNNKNQHWDGHHQSRTPSELPPPPPPAAPPGSSSIVSISKSPSINPSRVVMASAEWPTSANSCDASIPATS